MRKKLLGGMVLISMLSILFVGCGIKESGKVNSSKNSDEVAIQPTEDVIDQNNTDTASASENSSRDKRDLSDIQCILVGSSLAKISIGQSKDDVIKALGEPSSQTKAEVWAADGNEHQDLTYDKEGIEISFVKKDDVFVASIIIIDESSKAKTCDNIMIGSTKDEILSVYKEFIYSDNYDNNIIVVGYDSDGIVISLDSNNKVNNIIVGAAAE